MKNRQHRIRLLLAIILVGNTLSSLASADSVKAHLGQTSYHSRIYAGGSEKSDQIYNSISTVSIKDGQRIELNQFFYSDKQDRVAVEEIVVFGGLEADSPIKKYVVKHFQLKENWEIQVVDNRLHFLKSNWKTGKVERDSEKIKGHFVVGPLVRTLLKKKWPQLLAGEKLKVRFAVPARKETVGFEIFRHKKREVPGANFVVLKMEPSSFLISMIVDPFYMRVSKDGTQIFQTTGYNLPRKMIDGEWKDAVVDTVFDYSASEKASSD